MKNNPLVFMGDVHCEHDKMLAVLDKFIAPIGVIQVGDICCGMGFERFLMENRSDVGVANRLDPLRFICGNHDNRSLAKSDNFLKRRYLGDYGILDLPGYPAIGYLSGEFSVDADVRLIGRDWWPDEELSFSELGAAIDYIAARRPKIIVTHGPPAFLLDAFGVKGKTKPSRTALAVEELVERINPDLHVFGHMHDSKVFRVNGTRHVCLGILDYMEL